MTPILIYRPHSLTSLVFMFILPTPQEEKILRNNRAYETLDTNKNGVRFRNSSLKSSNIAYLEVKQQYAEQQKTVVAEVMSIACGYVEPLGALSDILAYLDVLVSFAQVSADAPTPYVRPQLHPKGCVILFSYLYYKIYKGKCSKICLTCLFLLLLEELSYTEYKFEFTFGFHFQRKSALFCYKYFAPGCR